MHERARFFSEETWTGGVIGLGYVGLPLAVSLVEAGLDAVGFDSSEDRVRMLEAGSSPIEDISDERLQRALDSGLEVTADAKRLIDTEVIFICVPSPLGRNREPDMSFIRDAAATVGEVVRPGMLVSLESTTYPGTTEDVLVPAIEAAGL